MSVRPYQDHLQSSDDLVTTYEATRAGFKVLHHTAQHLRMFRPARPVIFFKEEWSDEEYAYRFGDVE